MDVILQQVSNILVRNQAPLSEADKRRKYKDNGKKILHN